MDMNKDDVLQKAIAEGIISEEQRAKLEALAADDKGDSEERLKPVGTFNEIFVTIGVAILTSAVAGLFGLLMTNNIAQAVVGAFIYVVTAEYFHTRKRFRLPIIYAALGCTMSLSTAVMAGLVDDPRQIFDDTLAPYIWITTLAVAMAVLALFAWRYLLPFLMLPISIIFAVVMTIAAKTAESDISYKLVLGASSLAILAFAVRCDLRDRFRTTRLSDFAFWSYMIGSPLFVHSLFLSVLMAEEGKDWAMSGLAWLATLLLVLLVSFAGLLLNRRALIVSTLVYVAFIIGRALTGLSMGSAATIALLTLLIIGLYVVCLGSRWREVRGRVMDKLPKHWTWVDKLPVR